MKIERFEDIIAWQKSKTLALLIYADFKNCRDFAFKDQIQRASLSVMNNIAEGYERMGNKEFSKFLYIAKGSSGEVRSMLIIARDFDYLSQANFDNLYTLSIEISKILSGLIKSIQ